MGDERDPIVDGATDSADLYDIATWESRSLLDRASGGIYRLLSTVAPYVVGLFVLVVVALELLLVGAAVVSLREPIIGAFILLSVVPAFALAAYIWYADVTSSEPVWLLALTFLLGILLAMFAAFVNSLLQPLFGLVPVAGTVLFFFLVVGPIEETVKWLAVRLWAYRSDRFDAVIDGAVYGAMAGLGFATIENALYITQSIGQTSAIGSQQIAAAGQTAAVRLLAGPGHVIYSAFAGYYLGLAKFNREHAGPIVVKGLLIAVFIHATYNTSVTYLMDVLALLDVAVPAGLAFIGFVVLYDGVFGYLLYRKIARYRTVFRQVNMAKDVSFGDGEDERVESEGDVEGAPVEGDGEGEGEHVESE